MSTPPAVILTRTAEDNLRLSKQLPEGDLRVIDYPCIEISYTPYKKGQSIEGTSLQDFPVVIFTSRRGVIGMSAGYDLLSREDRFLAVVGESTASEVQQRIGRIPDLVAQPATGEALAHAIIAGVPPSQPLLYVRGDRTTGELARILRRSGFRLSELIVYRNTRPKMKPLTGVDGAVAVFASPSAVRGFLSVNPGLRDRLEYLAIGPVTAGYLRKNGVERVHQAPGFQHLTDRILAMFHDRDEKTRQQGE